MQTTIGTGITCAKCSHGFGQNRVTVKHATIAEVRACQLSGSFAAVRDDADMDRMVQEDEREEDERVAAFKFARDAQQAAASSLPAKASKPDIPAGKYALKRQDGQIVFYQVDRPEEGKWRGYTFTKRLVGGVGHWMTYPVQRQERDGIERAIAVDREGAARLFGLTAEACSHCSSPLSIPQSRAAGYGEKCAAKHGYWYPTLAEALKMLGEEG